MSMLFPAGQQFGDSNMDPVGAGKLYVYDNGTTNAASTYSDPDLVTGALSSPIVLDSSGRLTTNVYVANGTSYTVAVYTSADALVWSRDDTWGYTDGTLSQLVFVDDYAAGDGVTDDTAAIQSAAAALTSGGTLMFGGGKTYRIYPTGTLAGSAVDFCSFSSLDGVIIEGNGATLAIEDSLTTSEQIVLFKFSGCTNCVVQNLKNTSDQTVAVSSGDYGTNFVDATSGTKNLAVRNVSVIGAMTGVRCYRTPASQAESTKVRGVTVENCYFENVGQPLSFQNSGDDVNVRSTYINYTKRGYFPYGVRNHDIDISIRNATTSVLRVAAYSTDTTTNYCENINVNLTVDGYDNTTAAPLGEVVAIYDSAANGCALRNIRFTYNVKFNDSSSTSQRLLNLAKQISAGSSDSTASRGHIFENISVSGSVYGVDIAGHEVCEIFRNGDFSDETCRNIGFRDLVVTGGVNHVLDLGDMTSMTGAFFLENCHFDGTAVISPSDWGTYGVKLRNTYLGAKYWDNASYPVTYTGTTNLRPEIDTAYLNSSGGAVTATLPDGDFIGQKITIVMTDASNSSTVTVTSHATTDGEVGTFAAVDDTWILQWTGNEWINLASAGVTGL